MPASVNTLYYGDNLDVLRRYVRGPVASSKTPV
jgi:hypothetical protein